MVDTKWVGRRANNTSVFLFALFKKRNDYFFCRRSLATSTSFCADFLRIKISWTGSEAKKQQSDEACYDAGGTKLLIAPLCSSHSTTANLANGVMTRTMHPWMWVHWGSGRCWRDAFRMLCMQGIVARLPFSSTRTSSFCVVCRFLDLVRLRLVVMGRLLATASACLAEALDSLLGIAVRCSAKVLSASTSTGGSNLRRWGFFFFRSLLNLFCTFENFQ